jgi:ligand-binding sensor domain-containing protein
MPKQHWFLIFMIGILSFEYPLWSYAQEWVTYTSRDGLAGDTVNVVAVDGEQNLWFGTQSGLSKFDGTNWTTYRTDDGLIFDSVTSIAFDSVGNAWIGTFLGVSKFDGRFWKSYTTADGLADNSVWSILVDRKGNLWCGTMKGGVSRFDGTHWETYNAQNVLKANWVCSIAEDQNGDLWFGTNGGGVSRFDGTNWTTYTPADGLADLAVYSVAIDKKGDKWFGTGKGVSRFDGTNWTTYTTADGLTSNEITSVVIDRSGIVWIGTSIGSIHSFDGESWQTHSIGKTAFGNIIWSMAVDGNGNLWAAPQKGGVKMLPRAAWQVAIPKTVTTSIAIDNQGALWVGTYDKGVSHFDGRRWRTYTTADGLAGNNVWAIAIDRNGVAWFGTDNGVSRFDGAHWQTYTVADGLGGNKVQAIVEDKAGNLWFGTDGEISVFDGVNWHTHSPLIAPQVGNVGYAWGLAVADNGDVWAAGPLYVAKFDGKEWTIYTTADGLFGYANFKIAIGKDGVIWVATNGGVARYEGQKWKVFNTADGLPDIVVKSIGVDGNGNVWAGVGISGLARFDGTSWSRETIPVGSEEAIIAMNFQTVHSITTDADGNVWFATNGGIAHYVLDKVPPKTYVTNAPKGTIGIDTVLIEFIGADLVTPTAELKYSHKLDDGDWSTFSKSTRVEYTHLSHGTHTFSVRAKDFDGNIDPTPAEWTFNIDVGMPNAVITNPKRGDTVTGIVNIIGTAFDPDFEAYTVEYGKGEAPKEWIKIGGRAKFPLRDNTLAFWDARGLSGMYSIRLTVTDSFGHKVTDQITVNVVTAKETIDRQKGGIIADSSGKVSLYVPPNATTGDVEYTIAPLLEEQFPKPSELNIKLTLTAYEFQPEYITLKKPVTLLFRYDSEMLSPSPPHPLSSSPQSEDALALFWWDEASGRWRYKGGAVDKSAKTVTIAAERLGRYALSEIAKPAKIETALQSLNCQPRIFSPRGDLYPPNTLISFGLKTDSPITLKIYNTTGRLERILVQNKHFRRGENAALWDGKDDDGKVVTSGIYIVILEMEKELQTKTVGVLNR